MNYRSILVYLLSAIILSGCASFGKGIAQGILEKSEEEDKRECQIWSAGFDGIGKNISNTRGKVKVIMVHGVGHHIPGYSTILLENLAKELDLTVIEDPFKELTLTDFDDLSKDLGNLRLNRLLSKDRSRELLFYELTWSSITDVEKEVLAYDSSGQHSFRRAQINDILKKFSNDAIADPLIYLGNLHEDIQKSVGQSLCWMISRGWSNFPSGAHELCEVKSEESVENAKNDEYIFISHSLGSRITIDALQRLAGFFRDENILRRYPEIEKIHHAFQDRELTVFMLSNQLPLLQLGRSLPEIVNQHEKYCSQNGDSYAERFANQTHIVAFSDPNDLLSYIIPADYKDKYLDSRMCSKISNININVAHVINLFGITELVNPMAAHTGYDNDERVVAMLAHGLGEGITAPLIDKRCEWIETITTKSENN